MVYCNKCVIYSKEYDQLNQLSEDTGKTGCNYCRMFENGIPQDIVDDKEECPYHVEV